jgi:type II secretory pathway pseudopilin PulG
VYHWRLDEYDPLPTQMFDRFQSNKGNIPLHYCVSDDFNWCLLATLGGRTMSSSVSGSIQLYSVTHKACQVISGHAGAFATIKVPNKEVPSQFVVLSEQQANSSNKSEANRILFVELGEQSKKPSAATATATNAGMNKKDQLAQQQAQERTRNQQLASARRVAPIPTDDVCSPPPRRPSKQTRKPQQQQQQPKPSQNITSTDDLFGGASFPSSSASSSASTSANSLMSPTSALWSMDHSRDFVVRIVATRQTANAAHTNGKAANGQTQANGTPLHSGIAYIITKLGLIYLTHIRTGTLLASVNVFESCLYDRASVVFAVCEHTYDEYHYGQAQAANPWVQRTHTNTASGGIRLLANYGDLISVCMHMDAVVYHCLHTIQNVDIAYDVIMNNSSEYVNKTAKAGTSASSLANMQQLKTALCSLVHFIAVNNLEEAARVARTTTQLRLPAVLLRVHAITPTQWTPQPLVEYCSYLVSG